jgi:Holliday junction resolvasome RuvABC endonuclease subunit
LATNNSKRVILALDQSLASSGYAIFELPLSNGEAQSITFGQINTVKKISSKKQNVNLEFTDWQRMGFLKDKILHLCEEYSVDTVIFELPFIRQHFKSSIQLQQLYAVINVEIERLKLPTQTLSAKGWPKLIGLNSTKEPLLKLLKPYGITTDHQSDAIGIGLAYLQLTENKLNSSKGNRIIDTVALVNSFKYSSGKTFSLRQ